MRGILISFFTVYLACSAIKVGILEDCGCPVPGDRTSFPPDVSVSGRDWCKDLNVSDTGISLNNRLIRACVKGDAGLVKQLISQGAKPSYTDKFNRTPLMYAARFGHADVATALCVNGADVKAEPVYAENWSALKHNFDDLVVGPALHEAALNGNVALARILLEHGADVNQVNVLGKTALFYAAREGRTEFVKWLLENRADASLKMKYYDETALTQAIKTGRAEIVDMLLTTSVKSDTDIMVDALMAAIKADDLDMLCRLMRAGARVYYEWRNRRNNYNRYSALIHAADLGHTRLAEFLLCAKAPIDWADRNYLPIMAAAKSGNAGTVRCLIGHGAKINVGVNSENTLECALKGGNVEVVKQIAEGIEHQKLLQQIMSGSGFWDSSPEIFRYLIKRVTDSLSMSVTSEAFYNNIRPALKNCSIENIGCLLDLGVPLNLESLGYTRLMVHAALGRIEDMKKEIGEDNPRNMFREINVNKTGQNGITPLSCAIAGGHLDAVRLLVENGADINTVNQFSYNHSETPLERAFYYGQPEMVRYLTEKGATVSRKNIDGSLHDILLDFSPFGNNRSERSYVWNACEQDNQGIRYNLPPARSIRYHMPLLLMVAVFGDSALFCTVADRNDPDLRNEDYLAAFLISASLGYISITEHLLKKYPFISSQLYSQGETGISVGGASLIMAARNGHLAMVKLLTADPFPKTVWEKHLSISNRAAEYEGHREIQDLMLRRILGDY